MEVYQRDFYAIKFHLKAHRNSPAKYSLMTGLNEARPVINTCVGANMQDESDVSTKRFRVYRRFMAIYFTEDSFEHFFHIKKSSYLLICKTEFMNHSDLLSDLDEKFKDLYS